MALFKVNKGLAKNLMTNVPNAKEGFAYFTTDDGKFYIDIAGDGTSTTKAVIGTNRIPLNAYTSDVLKASSMPTDDNIVYPILAFSLKDATKNLIEAKYTQIGIKNGSLVIPNVVGKDEILISNTGAGRGIVIDNTNGTGHAIEITAGKGIKVAKDPIDNLELATKQYVDKILSANDAMIFKGILDDTHSLPNTHETGWTYRVNKAGTYAGQVCEIGDLVICVTDGLSANNTHWIVAQTNIDGAVTGPTSSTVNAVPTFADATGKVIKNNSTVTINDTGLFTAPYIATGTDKTHYFQSRKFRGEGNADTYYHAIDFGYSGHNQVDFHEYGGIWNFYENTKGTAADGKLVASIKSDGFHGNLNGNATTATKVNNNLVIKLNNGTTEGTNQFTYNGSATRNINITSSSIGAASSSHNHDSSYVKKSGDTMTGDLKFQKTNTDGTTSTTATIGAATGYITGTWLQTTSVGNKAGDFATIDSSGWIYKRTAAQVLSDIGAASNSHNHDTNYVKKTGDTMTGQLAINKAGYGFRVNNGSTGYIELSRDGGDAQLYGLWDCIKKIWLVQSDGTNVYFHGNADSASRTLGDVNGLQIDTNYLKLSGGTMRGSINCQLPSTTSTATNTGAMICHGQAGGNNGMYVGNGDADGSILGTNGKANLIFKSWQSIGFVDGCSSTNAGITMTINTRTGVLRGNKLWGAVWNDYAECREVDIIEPGKCVIEVGDDTLTMSTERLMPGANITSDTFGFAIGETEQAKTPIAVSGRVLAYPYESREEFKKNIGRPVCSGPNGTVSIMTDEEYRDKGYCAIGTISAVPDYEEWGTGKVKVNGRVWIKVF